MDKSIINLIFIVDQIPNNISIFFLKVRSLVGAMGFGYGDRIQGARRLHVTNSM